MARFRRINSKDATPPITIAPAIPPPISAYPWLAGTPSTLALTVMVDVALAVTPLASVTVTVTTIEPTDEGEHDRVGPVDAEQPTPTSDQEYE